MVYILLYITLLTANLIIMCLIRALHETMI